MSIYLHIDSSQEFCGPKKFVYCKIMQWNKRKHVYHINKSFNKILKVLSNFNKTYAFRLDLKAKSTLGILYNETPPNI